MSSSELRSALADLDADSPFHRAQACKQLGELGRREAVRALIGRLEVGEDPAVRRQAALALGSIGDPSALEAIELVPASDQRHAMIFDLATVFDRVASQLREGLGAKERRKDVRRLLTGLGHAEPSVVRRCQTGLAFWGEHALKDLARALKDDDEAVRLAAVVAAEQIRRKHPGLQERVVTLLLPRIDDASAAVRRQVPLSLRYQRDPRVAERLIPRLRDPEPTVRLQAMLALETLDAFEAIPEIAWLAENDPTQLGPNVRIDTSAASVLGTLRRKRGPA